MDGRTEAVFPMTRRSIAFPPARSSTPKPRAPQPGFSRGNVTLTRSAAAAPSVGARAVPTGPDAGTNRWSARRLFDSFATADSFQELHGPQLDPENPRDCETYLYVGELAKLLGA